MTSYYLWSGIAEIEDLEDATTDEQALKALHDKTGHGDWTLWKRNGYRAQLLAINVRNEQGKRAVLEFLKERA